MSARPSHVAETRAALGQGYSDTPTYNSWRAMLNRCYDPKARGYEHYGGRGIVVCERWRESFLNFHTDLGERPSGTILDRIKVNENYEPGNCRWATWVQSARNKRGTTLAEIEGESPKDRHKRSNLLWEAGNREARSARCRNNPKRKATSAAYYLKNRERKKAAALNRYYQKKEAAAKSLTPCTTP